MKKDVWGSLPVVFQKGYDLTLWYCRHTVRFPKGYRFTLADEIQKTLFDLLEALQDASFGYLRQESLLKAQKAIDRMRLWNRLSLDLGCLSPDQYAYAAERIEEVGKQIGGWSKKVCHKAERGEF